MLHNAVQLQWMMDRVGVDEHIGSFQYAIIWHTFVISKPKFGLANSVRFTEYVRAIVTSLLQTSIFTHQLQGSTICRS